MRLEKFVEPGEIDPAELNRAALHDRADGADPEVLVRFLSEEVGLPEEDARLVVGHQNAQLESTLYQLASSLEGGREPHELSGELVAGGWPGDVADALIARVRRELGELARTRDGRGQLLANNRRRMWWGIAWIGVGVFCGAGLWLAAQRPYGYMPGGLTQFAMVFGPIGYGGQLLIRSVVLWFNYRSGSQET